jgi:hypothetical protein
LIVIPEGVEDIVKSTTETLTNLETLIVAPLGDTPFAVIVTLYEPGAPVHTKPVVAEPSTRRTILDWPSVQERD